MPETDTRLPRDDEDFTVVIKRIHPKSRGAMTPTEQADWYCDCVDWIGYFGFRDAKASGTRR